MRPAVWCVAAVAVSAAACSRSDTSAQTTLAPLVTGVTIPESTALTTTTVSFGDPSTPLLAALPEGECAFDSPASSGEVTFLAGDRLVVVAPDGTGARCVATVAAEARGPMRWSPRGERVLVGSATVIDEFGTRSTGFDSQNVLVRWEYPSGDALIAPTASGDALVRRNVFDAEDRSTRTFLARTDIAVSHPSGSAYLAAGETADGLRGLFTESDIGPRQIVRVVEEESITEIAVDPAGDVVYFIAGPTSGGSATVHRLHLLDLALADLSREVLPTSELTVGPVPGTVAWRLGLCNTITELRAQDSRDGSVRTVGAGTALQGLSLTPAGWLDGVRLVVSARPLGCDGPSDVWIWNVLDGSATLLVRNVELAAVRLVRADAGPLFVNDAAQPPLA